MTSKPTERDLIEEVEELLAKATPGPYALIATEGDLRWRVVAVDGYGETRRLITVMPLESDWQNSRNNGLLFAASPDLLRRLVAEVKARDELIVHMHVHSGYPNNGYMQMTTPQKELYDVIWSRSVKELDDEERNSD